MIIIAIYQWLSEVATKRIFWKERKVHLTHLLFLIDFFPIESRAHSRLGTFSSTGRSVFAHIAFVLFLGTRESESCADCDWFLFTPDLSVSEWHRGRRGQGDSGKVAEGACVSVCCTLCGAENKLELEQDAPIDYGAAADAVGYGKGSHDWAS